MGWLSHMMTPAALLFLAHCFLTVHCLAACLRFAHAACSGCQCCDWSLLWLPLSPWEACLLVTLTVRLFWGTPLGFPCGLVGSSKNIFMGMILSGLNTDSALCALVVLSCISSSSMKLSKFVLLCCSIAVPSYDSHFVHVLV